MALIKCPECGNNVSEYAAHCPHCGFNIAEELKEYVCPDCGQIVKGKKNPCPNCDCPPQFFINKGELIPESNISVKEHANSQVSNVVSYSTESSQSSNRNVDDDSRRSKISWFIAKNSGKLSESKMRLVKEKMETMSDTEMSLLLNTQLTSPVLVWVISFFFGFLGLDRFLIGSIGAGVIKLLTCGLFGIWWFIDLFLIAGACKERNFNKIATFIV